MPMLLGAAAGITVVQVLAILAAWLLQRSETFLRRYLPLFVALGVGVLLATAILHLLPEAVTQIGNRKLLWLLFGGSIVLLFAMERLVSVLTGVAPEAELAVVPSRPEHAHPRHTRPANLILASMLHSFVDGAAVTTAFAAGGHIGWLTTFAIALHEIPHRAGDFALLIHLAVPAPRALRLIILAGVPAFVGVLAVSLFGLDNAQRTAWLLPVSAGSFLYIAAVNLMPELDGGGTLRKLSFQLLSLGAGIGLVLAAAGVFPS